jgi:insertion element IS1 protein InsB
MQNKAISILQLKKSNYRFIWIKISTIRHAIDHLTGTVLAYVFGNRKDIVFEQLKSLLEPFGHSVFIQMIGAYERKIPAENHVISKKILKK